MQHPYGHATRFHDLPARVRAAIAEAAPVAPDALDTWIHQPLPALGERSVVQVLADGDHEAEFEIVLMCASAGGRG